MVNKVPDTNQPDKGISRVGVIGAMAEEVELLKSSLENMQLYSIAGYDFYVGSLNGLDLVLLRSGIGKVNAAIGTTLLLQNFQISSVISKGSAGGYDPELNVGDVVISSGVCHHDVDLTVFGYEPGQIPQQPAVYLPDERLVSIAERCIPPAIKGAKIVKGLIATGDQFMDDPERVERRRKLFPAMKAVEMEAAAIAQACYQFKVPFVVIRSLSDIAGKKSDISFKQFIKIAAKNSAETVISMFGELQKLNNGAP